MHAEDKVSEKAETSHEESNAASLAIEATGINSADAEQDEPVNKSAHHILTGSLDVKVKTSSSGAITSDFDPKSQSDNALETNIIERDGTFSEEVRQQKSLVHFVREHISTYIFIFLCQISVTGL